MVYRRQVPRRFSLFLCTGKMEHGSHLLIHSKLCRILLIFFMFSFLYLCLWIFGRYHFGSEFKKTDRLYVCLEDRIRTLAKKIAEFDAFHVTSNQMEMGLLTFVGNGRIGASFQRNDIFIRLQNFSFKTVPIPILFELDVHGYISEVSHVLDIVDGVMHRISCFKHEMELCISSESLVYVHRIYTSLLVQNFFTYNPLSEDITVKIEKDDLREVKGMKTSRTIRLTPKKPFDDGHSRPITYQLMSMVLEEPNVENDVHKVTIVVIFKPTLPEKLTIKAGKTHSYTAITGVRASDHPISVTQSDLAQVASDHGLIGRERKALESLILSELTFALNLDEQQLRNLHTTAWNRIWLSGLTLSYSHAPHVLNGPQINTTLYYLAATVPDHYAADNQGNRTAIDVYVNRYRRRATCAPIVDLTISAVHWQVVRNTDQLNNLLDAWHTTLRTAQCEAYLEDGAHGLIQATLAAVGQMRQHANHTVVGLLPHTVNRDLIFRRVALLQPGSYVNIEMRVVPAEISLSSPHLMIFQLNLWRAHHPPQLGSVAQLKAQRLQPPALQSPQSQPISLVHWSEVEDGKRCDSDLLVCVEKEAESTPVFVCPAACAQQPVEVGYTKVSVPFLMTNPSSALMFIGHDARSLSNIEHGTYGETKPGPNPDHDLITLHRYGHKLGGLPWLFWITLGLLITLFHLFLCKFIYNELLRDRSEMEENYWRAPKKYEFQAAGNTNLPMVVKSSRRRFHRHTDDVP